MRAIVTAPRVRVEEALLVGLAALALVVGLTWGAGTPVPYVVLVLPIALALSWWRPVHAFALLLGLALITDQFEIDTLAPGIEPFLLQLLPIFQGLDRVTPLPVRASAVEIWLVVLAGIWAAKRLAAGDLRIRPVACPGAWALAFLTIAGGFIAGMTADGDLSAAIAEVRALSYLLGLAWLVPQLVERRGHLVLILGVMAAALGVKAAQGLYRYVVVLGMDLGPDQTFMAHEDPVLFVPLFYLLIALAHYRAAPRLTRVLWLAAPVMLVALVLTQRRTAYLTLLFCGAVFAVAVAAPLRRTFLRLAVPVLLALAAYAAAFAESASPLGRPIARALTLFDPTNTSNVYRLLELENLRYTILHHPWGIGFGQPYEIIRSMPKLDFVFWEYTPHNEILWIWVKTGTLGFIVVMFFFARVIAESVWMHRTLRDPLLRAIAPIVALAVANQLVASYFELQLTYARNMIYLGTLLGLLAPIRDWGGLARSTPLLLFPQRPRSAP